MKKFLFILLGTAFVSCNFNATKDTFTNEPIPWSYATEFQYKGHSYIKFAKDYAGGVVHNPDCSCFKDSIK